MGIRKAGIDIGSRTIKFVVFDGDQLVVSRKTENSFDTINDCRKLIGDTPYDYITATGYGRHLFAEYFEGSQVISEIKAFALGVYSVVPSCRTILDIGGQDTKAISLDEHGRMKKFEMNDKCAAGTGRFIEIMSMALRYTLDEFGDKAMESKNEQKVNSMCTVFAESEVVALLSKGILREDIAKGIARSIISRAAAQLRRVGVIDTVVFVGGVALNSAMGILLEEQLQLKIHRVENPQMMGAIGAALSVV